MPSCVAFAARITPEIKKKAPRKMESQGIITVDSKDPTHINFNTPEAAAAAETV